MGSVTAGMSGEKLERKKLHEFIVEQVQALIVSGELMEGDSLPPESSLANQFGVSRTVVREALQVLHERGLVEVRQGQGVFVTRPTIDVVASALRLVADVAGASMFDVAEVRELLETEACALAAERATGKNLQRLEECLRRMEENADDAERFLSADVGFHRELVRATGNLVLEMVTAPVYGLMREQRGSIFHVKGSSERAIEHHREVLEALRSRDPDRAREAMLGHIDQVRDEIERLGANGHQTGQTLRDKAPS